LAIGFGATRGSGTTDIIATTYTTNTATRSVAFWYKRNGTSGTLAACFKSIWSVAYVVGTGWRIQHNFSTTNGQWNYNVGTSTATWLHIVATYDNSSTANVPTLYLGGVAQTLTSSTSPVGSASTSANAYRIGNVIAGTSVFDGDIAEFAAWDRILTQAEATTLAGGFSPHHVLGPVIYCDLVRNIFDWRANGVTTTGTAVQAHPRVYRRSGKRVFSIVTPAVGTGSLALSPLAIAGTSTETFTGTGSEALSSLATSGTATETFTGTGSEALSPLGTSSTGAETFTGTGSEALSSFALAASAAEIMTGTASLALSPFDTSSAGAESFASTGALALSPFDSAASGVEAFTGTGSVALSPFAIDATGGETFTSVGALALSPFGFIGAGSVPVNVTSTGTLALSPFGTSASGALSFLSTGSLSLSSFGLSATGTLTVATIACPTVSVAVEAYATVAVDVESDTSVSVVADC